MKKIFIISILTFTGFLLFGGIFYAKAQGGSLPDLMIENAKFKNGQLTATLMNGGGADIDSRQFQLGIQWLNKSGKTIGSRRWINFVTMLKGEVKLLNSNNKVDVAYKTDGIFKRTVADRLDWYLDRRPDDAYQLRLYFDELNVIPEQNEDNNVVVIDFPRPDLLIQDVNVDGENISFTYINKSATKISNHFNITFQWVNSSGDTLTGERWINLASMDAYGFTKFYSYGADAAYKSTGIFKRTVAEKLHWYIERKPVDATGLRVVVDGTGDVTEINEDNNTALVIFGSAEPEPEVVSDFESEGESTDPQLDSEPGLEINTEPEPKPNQQPIAQAGEDVIVYVGEELTFSAEGSLDPDGYIVSYDWDFSDGSSANGFRGTHYYNKPGIYTIILKVIDGGGLTDTDIKEVNVKDKPKPVFPDLTFTNAVLIEKNLTFKYKNIGEAESAPISFWYEGVNNNGDRVGELYWLDVGGVPVGETYNSSQSEDLIIYSAIGKKTFGEFLNSLPNEATHLKIHIDGPNKIIESDETNNTAVIQIIRPEAPSGLPDLFVSNLILDYERITFKYKNNGGATGKDFDITFFLVDADGRPREKSWMRYYSASAMQAGEERIFDSDKETIQEEVNRFGDRRDDRNGMAKFLRNAPEEAKAMEVVIDNDFKIKESNEENNSASNKRPEPAFPDIVLIDPVFSNKQILFTYKNEGKITAENGGVSIWFEWIDLSGNRTGPLHWANMPALAPGASQAVDSSNKDFKVWYEKKHSYYWWEKQLYHDPLADVLANPPPDAKYLKVIIDGPNVIKESNEENNSALLARGDASFPDLTLTEGKYKDPEFSIKISNIGKESAMSSDWVMEWIGDNGQVLKTSQINTAHGELSAGKAYINKIKFRDVREDAIRYFLKLPPNGSRSLRVIIDPKNKIIETDEDNNIFLIQLTGAELNFGDVSVKDGIFNIQVQNSGMADSVATDIWMQWYGEGKWLDEGGVIDVPVIVAGAITNIDVPLSQSFRDGGQILLTPPEKGEKLRLFLDGSRKVEESNEQNNLVMVERSIFPQVAEPERELADLVFTDTGFVFVIKEKSYNEIKLYFTNSGKKEVFGVEEELVWLTADGKNAVPPHIFTVASRVVPGNNVRSALRFIDQGTTGAYLTHPPDNATHLRVSLDPNNEHEELDENNNTVIFSRSELLFPEVDTQPKLQLSLSVDVIKSTLGMRDSSTFANIGLGLATATLLMGMFMVHGHNGTGKTPVSFFSLFPMLFTSSQNSYMKLRKCGSGRCKGEHFNKHKKLKRFTKASLAAVGATGAIKLLLIVFITTLSPSAVSIVQASEINPGDQTHAVLVVKNVGNGTAINTNVELLCPQTTSLVSGKFDNNSIKDISKGVDINEFKANDSHTLEIICKVGTNAVEKGLLIFKGYARIKGDSKVNMSNQVNISVVALVEPEPKISALPDLIVEGVSYSPISVAVKDMDPFSTIFTGIINNQGKADAKTSRSRLRLDIGSNGIWDIDDPSLFESELIAPGGVDVVIWEASWNAPFGSYMYEVCADVENEVEETDESNNCKTGQFTIAQGSGEEYQ